MDTTLSDKLTSRKLWIAVCFEIVFTILLCYGKLPTSVYESLSYMLLGGYYLSNTATNIMLAKKS
jgi:hypothetical protein